MASQGMLYVTMQPQEGLLLDQFHEWYNNEHGPTRLRLPSIFSNGLRYRATDGQQPAFLAAYDVRDMALLATPTYTQLRANRSSREAETIGQVAVQRSFFRLLESQQAASFVASEDISDMSDGADASRRVLVAIELTVKAETDADKAAAVYELQRWNAEEHYPMLAKVPGWLRSRLFRIVSEEAVAGTAPNATKEPVRLVSLHEYAPVNGLGGPEHKASMATPWLADLASKHVAGMARRTYELFYVFGPAPRDLTSLGALPAVTAAKRDFSFSAADGRTATTPGPTTAAIRSFVTVPSDGLAIPYVLEGNTAPDAPTIAFCNSLLTSLHMWDDFVALLRQHRPQYRILRYDVRGRHEGLPQPPQPATMAMLADDLQALLRALRIPRLHALVGVSQGGATALQFALRSSPEQLGRVIACDFNVASSAANTESWKSRIAMAKTPETNGKNGKSGMQELAEATVARWFAPETAELQPARTQQMVDMVAANAVEGFEYGCQALWNYDMSTEAPGLTVPALLVAGEGDGRGALVRAMDGFRGKVGPKGAELRVVPAAGHLPMYENPKGFWAAVEDIL